MNGKITFILNDNYKKERLEEMLHKVDELFLSYPDIVIIDKERF